MQEQGRQQVYNMSSLKPDYFIASNGLPNILNNHNNGNSNSTRHMIRHVPTTTRNRLQRNNNVLHKDESGKNHKNKQNFMEARKAPTSTVDNNHNSNNRTKLNHINLKKSKKDLINTEIKASNSHEIFLSTSSHKIEADNKCSWNFERLLNVPV